MVELYQKELISKIDIFSFAMTHDRDNNKAGFYSFFKEDRRESKRVRCFTWDKAGRLPQGQKTS